MLNFDTGYSTEMGINGRERSSDGDGVSGRTEKRLIATGTKNVL